MSKNKYQYTFRLMVSGMVNIPIIATSEEKAEQKLNKILQKNCSLSIVKKYTSYIDLEEPTEDKVEIAILEDDMKKIKNLTDEEINNICNKNCKNCRKCPLVISQSDYHIYCVLAPEK